MPAYDGSYVVPVVWQGRFIVFFAEFMKETVPQDFGTATLPNISDTPSQARPLATWEIKLGWTELRSGKWSQEQITTGSDMETATAADPLAIDGYRFVFEFLGTSPEIWVSIGVYNNTNSTAIGRFEFHGAQAYVATVDSTTTTLSWTDTPTSFHFTVGTMPTSTAAGTLKHHVCLSSEY